jgi:23S rRNA (uracil1939-C5)-methyltransferase
MTEQSEHRVWHIERLVPGGDGFTRLSDGRIGFARGALPGDHIRPHRTETRRGYVRALEWELMQPSADRVEPRCAVAGRCGGCDLMALNLPAQLRSKASILREALSRTGGFRDLTEPPVISAGSEFGYRNRLRLHIDQRGKIGLFARASHEIVEISECPVCDPAVNLGLSALREIAKRDPAGLASFSEVELRAASSGSSLQLHFVPRYSPNLPEPDFLLELANHFAVSVAGGRSARGQRRAKALSARERQSDFDENDLELQRHPLPGGLELGVPPSAFAQVNWAVNQALIERILGLVAKHRIQTFIEVYAGSGNFTLPLIALGLSGIAIEGNTRAASALKHAAREIGASLRVLSGDALECFGRLRRQTSRPDLVLLDPPRAGAHALMRGIVELGSRHVALCACDPVTLARDLRCLREAGYQLEVLEGFDMFPQTHHVEALVWMTRPGTGSR